MRLDGEPLHGDAFALEHLRDVVCRGFLVARRARRVHANERLEMPESLGVECRARRRGIGLRSGALSDPGRQKTCESD
ncbi:hypothetical protein D3C83_100690 [compost metagenome]